MHCSPFVLAALEVFGMAIGAQRSNVLGSMLESGLLEITTVASFRPVLVEEVYQCFLLSRGPEGMTCKDCQG